MCVACTLCSFPFGHSLAIYCDDFLGKINPPHCSIRLLGAKWKRNCWAPVKCTQEMHYAQYNCATIYLTARNCRAFDQIDYTCGGWHTPCRKLNTKQWRSSTTVAKQQSRANKLHSFQRIASPMPMSLTECGISLSSIRSAALVNSNGSTIAYTRHLWVFAFN